jgi:hypothetical protein
MIEEYLWAYVSWLSTKLHLWAYVSWLSTVDTENKMAMKAR